MVTKTYKTPAKRNIIANVIFAVLFIVLVVTLIKIQLVDRDKYATGDIKGQYTVVVDAARGEILDRNGNALVKNRQGNSIVFNAASFPSAKEQGERNKIIYSLIKLFEENNTAYIDWLPITVDSNGKASFVSDRDEDIEWLKSSDMLNLNSYATADNCLDALISRYSLEDYSRADAEKIASVCAYMKKSYFSAAYPYTFAEDVNTDIVSKIMENSSFYKGVENEIVAYREYVDGTIAPHILGRVSGISSETYASEKEKLDSEIEKAQESGASEETINALKRNAYTVTDEYGQSGIELAMEDYLRGTKGVKKVTTYTDGSVDEKYTVEPEQGNTVVLTIDKNLQEVAQKALKNRVDTLTTSSALPCAGAVIVMDVNTGEILACASYPTYDNTTYEEDYQELASDDSSPLWNRALMSTYEPGSTFKPAIAIAALQEGAITSSTTYNCTGLYTYYSDVTFKCTSRHGTLNVTEAINKSCNCFFYDAARVLGITKMNEWCTMLGFGQKTGCELPEAQGILAGPEERKASGGTWEPGDTVQAAIGQSDNQFTLIQLVNYCATIANGGTRYVPHFVKSVQSYDYSETVLDQKPEVAAKLTISDKNFALVRKGMLEVGTIGFCASAFANLPVEAAAKTGTSQVIHVFNGQTIEGNNGFLITYAPYDDPQIAIAIVVETADTGATTAVVAADIYDYYFSAKGVDSAQNYNQLLS